MSQGTTSVVPIGPKNSLGFSPCETTRWRHHNCVDLLGPIDARANTIHRPDQMTFRFNNRRNPYLFRETLMKLLEAPVLEYKKLTAA